MKTFIKAFAVLLLAAMIFVALSSCQKKNCSYPRPSREFYCSDFAEALLPGSRHNFIVEGERLYEDTKEIEEIGGAQVVVATMLLDSEDQAAEIDRTELFREWRIGKNDMGLLILLLFVENGEYLELVRTEIEIGYRMESYITAARAGYVVDNCLYNEEWEGSVDMGLGEMYYELLSDIYTKAYGYESFDYDMETYRDYLINYSDDNSAESLVPMSFWVYLFSPYSPPWSKAFGIGGILLVLLLGGGGFVMGRTKGGGGRSGGYGIRR
jgi:hypothetical protein